MNLKNIFNKSVFGTIGYISSYSDIELVEQYLVYNMPVLKEFKKILVSTNYGNLELISYYNNLWKKYFPDCLLINFDFNRGHNFGTADLDDSIFDWCKENNENWLVKTAIDFVFEERILEKNIEEADFYYLNGISYEDLYLNNFNYKNTYDNLFYPQTNFYIIDVSKCDYLNDKDYIDKTYEQVKKINNYNGKIWEYIEGWSCENFLKNCIIRNNLKKQYLLDVDKHIELCEAINYYKIGDPYHKNIMIEGVCHYQYYDQPIIEI